MDDGDVIEGVCVDEVEGMRTTLNSTIETHLMWE